VKLLLDAQLPHRLVRAFAAAGHDAIHAFDLPSGSRTPDQELTALATREARIMVTKDADFVASFWLRRLPPKLLLFSTGNISNDELWQLLAPNLGRLETAFLAHDFVELNRTAITVHA
jgi:predicted nuclease of predicted toxin-antitoxin system